ncbi:MAG: topoisomerase [Sneathiella sp.]|uniref:DnaB-like helicase C-terminal domain-containing protein n=1 Tax=Sneathiella sp. TaxID=1964365 RepID=UPI000C6540B3|nr:DnaB-like helicase C-terminal domain-containing protein [Sneathiella sp.]MAZ04231.1 topoisomerase [Sneathiella sp.]
MMQQQKWLDRGPCPKCGSSDANVNHASGYSYCFACETRFGDNILAIPKQEVKAMSTTGNWGELSDRKISMETAKKYNTKIKSDGNIITHHLYGYFDELGNQIATKVRQTKDKKMWSEGEIGNAVLFGQNIFSPKGKYVTVCEGEVDAMSAYQMMGSKWPCVSIKTGSAGALRDCKKAFSYLDSFDTVVLSFDMDKAGRKATEEVAQLFAPNKCKIVHLEHKDSNEYLKMGKGTAFTQAWWNAQPYTPAGIINLKDLGSSLYDEEYCETCLYPWPKMNEKTYGMRTGELVTFTSGAGMGKSSIMRELMHHLLKNTEDNIGVLALEESVKNTAWNIMSVEASSRLYIKEVREGFTREELEQWQDSTINSGRFFAFDHFGSIGNDEILSRVRFMAQALGCKWVVLDHLSILVSGQDESFGDERKSIDILMTKLRSLVEQTGIGLLLVSHLRRPSGDRGHEEGKEVSLSHLRGSASIAHLSDGVIALERNQQEDDEILSNTTIVRILKNRYTGETGIATHLFYDRKTGRMTEIDNPFDTGEDE